MAAFTTADKVAVAREFYERHFQFQSIATPWSKAELSAAIDSINNWIDTNQASFASALSSGAPAFQAASSSTQRILLFTYVALRRAGVI